MVLHSNSTTNPLLRTNRPVLLERLGAIDRRLIDAGGDGDVVGAAVGGDLALDLGAAAGVVGAVGFDYVVFYEGVAGPAVDGEVAVSLGVEGAAVVDGAVIGD